MPLLDSTSTGMAGNEGEMQKNLQPTVGVPTPKPWGHCITIFSEPGKQGWPQTQNVGPDSD